MNHAVRIRSIFPLMVFLCVLPVWAGPAGGQVVINELMADNENTLSDSAGDYDDWIELYNSGDQALDVGSMYLTDDLADPTKWQIPDSNALLTTIAPHAYLLVWADDEGNEGPLHAAFKLGAGGEDLGLYDAAQNQIDTVSFGAQQADVSYGRWPDGSDNWQSLRKPTPGNSNQAEAAQVIITEIMYHAYHGQGAPENKSLEYIELFNAASAAVNLSGWRFSNGVDFTFPDVALAAGAYLVVAADVNEFAPLYPGVTNVVGGWTGFLSNSGERIELADNGGTVIDWVQYADEGDWAVRELGPADHGHRGWTWSDLHDGGGHSLELINPAMSNEYGQNWTASAAEGGSPGRSNSTGSADIAPLVLEVEHFPIIPGPNDVITVSARVLDESPTGLTVRLHYRADVSVAGDWTGSVHEDLSSYQTATMFDDGTHDDLDAGDSIYGGQIPRHPDGTILEFYVEARDIAGKARTWPAASMVDGVPEQVNNALPMVDGSLSPYWAPGGQPVQYLIMLERERDELAYIGSHSNDSLSDAEMNGTFVNVDGAGVTARYIVGIRNRGAGSRVNSNGSYRNNYRINFTHDDPYNGVTALNIKNRFSYLQLLGSVVWQMADLPAPVATAIQLRINGQNLALNDSKMYGSYVALEVVDGDFAKNHFPDDPDGNTYQCTDDRADLSYQGTNPDSYRVSYQKQTNVGADDYSDLIDLTYALNRTPPENCVEEISKIVNLSQWLRFLAVDALVGNLEGGLTTPKGDDYVMYAGVRDRRFWMIPHDLDTLFGQGDHSPDINRDIHVYAGLDGLNELLTTPEVVAMYHRQCVDLIETVFSPEQFDPLADQMLGGWVPEAMIQNIKGFVRQRNAAILAQIPQELTIGSTLPVVAGYHHATTDIASLSGTADAVNTRSVVVAGQSASWSQTNGTWQMGRTSGGVAEPLVSQGAVWKYRDDGSDQGAAWTSAGFNDNDWSSGNTQLGYGDGDEATVIGYGPDTGAKYTTTYFRHSFVVADPSAYASLQLRLLRDDGAVVYLNGVEVVRSNMPDGPIDYLTPAGTNLSGTDEDTFVEFLVNPGLLANGLNVLAVEVHQFSGSSADISFDLTLDAIRPSETREGLRPGINRVPVKTFDGPDGTGRELSRGAIDIWFDTGLTNDYAQEGPAEPGVPAQPGLDLNLIVRDSYLPGIPVLVRVELVDETGTVRRDIWDATATLAVDNPNVQLSVNQVRLFNGLGSALVTFAGTGDFVLTAQAAGLQTAAPLADWSTVPVQTVSGTLGASTTWSGVYHVTGSDFIIPAGVTLTLDRGAMVLIDGVPSGSDGTDIQVEGSIQALGTAASPVTFTAYASGANWGEIRFVGAEPSTFAYTHITRAGNSPRVGHSNSGPTIRAQDSQIVFDHSSLTDNAGKTMHTTSGCDLVFRHCLLARSVMGPEIASTALLFEDSWITEMHAGDDADGIYIHSQQAGQLCTLSRGVFADLYDDGLDTLGSDVTIEDFIIRDCRDKGASVYDGQTTINHCLIVGNNAAPEDPTVASIAAKTFEGSTATVNIDHTTIVTSRIPGTTDIGIQAHNKYGVAGGTIVYNVTNSIIDATHPVDAQAPYLESDIHIDYSDVVDLAWPGQGNIDAAPLFVDADSGNYQLQADSPCIGAGSDGTDMGYYAPAERDSGGIVLSEDTVWLAEKGPYRLTGELVVPTGRSLTILPGTSVFFEPGARLLVHGLLTAEGEENAPIRFTRTPGTTGTWDGLQFIGSTKDNRITHAVIEYGRTDDGMVGVEDSQLLLDHVTFDHTDLRRIRTIDSSLVVRNCVFTDIFAPDEPPTTNNSSEHIWGSGVPDGGQFLIENNLFGTTKGHNDAIDFDGPSRPHPIPQILNNRFMGGGDDALDLETDAHIEGNTFANFIKDQYNTAPRESNVISAGRGKDYVVARNVFYNCGHVAQIKDRAFMTFVNNTVVDMKAAAFYFEIPGQTTSPGRGVYVDSCIFDRVATAVADFRVDDPQWGTTEITFNRSILIEQWHILGVGNIDADPLFIDGTSDFHLKSMSPAMAAGAGGLNMGAYVPGGTSVVGAPDGVTWRTSASLMVHGPGISHYVYSLTSPDGPWSEELPIDVPIYLTGLQDGASYRVYVLGKSSAGIWQTVANASRAWMIDTSYRRLVINEILAGNVSAAEYAGTFPDLVELYYDGPQPLDLSGMSVTDDLSQLARFVFAQGTVIQPGDYLVLVADADGTAPGIHLGFALDDQGGSVSLYDSQGLLVDSVTYGLQLPDLSVGRLGSDGHWGLTAPTFGQANAGCPVGDPTTVKINEWLAESEVLFADDFIELFNPQSAPVNLGGCYLTGNPAGQPDTFRFAPLTFVPAQGFAVFTADGRDLPGHVDLKLSANGELLSLLDPQRREIDKIIYTPQTIDVSQGRSPDGSSTLEFLMLPTPGAANPADIATTEVTNLVAIDSLWSYEQSGASLASSWYEPTYADSAWPTGAGVLYVESSNLSGPKNTELTLGATTYYFRTHFTLDTSPSNVTQLELTVLIDDGAVVYLNGREVLRLGMPVGAIDYETQAGRTVGNAEYEGPFAIPTNSLLQGDNVIAVEVHQINSTSSDIVMGLQLDASFVSMTDNNALANALALLDGLRVTELMYNAPEGDTCDFVELQNVSDVTLDLTGVRFTEGIDFVFGPLLLAPGAYAVVVDDPAAFASRYGGDIPVAGEYLGRLSNGGERLVLALPEPLDAAILRFTYSDTWYGTTDGAGDSLVVANPTFPPAFWNGPEIWYAASPTPGRP